MSDMFYGGYVEGWYNYAKPNRLALQRYNSIPWDQLWEKYEILRDLLGCCHEDTLIEPPFRCDNGKNIFIGRKFYANYNFTVLDTDTVTIGERVCLGPNVTLCTASHPLHPESRAGKDGFRPLKAPIVIEDDVWIGGNVMVLPGVTIGRGAVIGAGSIVNKDIPPMTVAVGNPCKVLREITDADRFDWDSYNK